MNRSRKLLLALAILGGGMLLAWPFQRAGELQPTPPLGSPDGKASPALDQDVLAQGGLPGSDVPGELRGPLAPIPARMASTAETASSPLRSPEQSAQPDQLPDSAVTAGQPGVTAVAMNPSADSDNARPAYPTIDRPTAFPSGSSWPTELQHLIRNGDTLEKLAERYLGDEGRALEIFEMNRDLLDNPHLLPIGIEIRIPAEPGRIVD